MNQQPPCCRMNSWNLPVSKGENAVLPIGQPMSHSTNFGPINKPAISGFIRPSGTGILHTNPARPFRGFSASMFPRFSASFALGVGIILSATAHPSLFGFVLPSPLHRRFKSFPAFAEVGVGHNFTCADSFGSPRLLIFPFDLSTQSSATGVCQNPDSIPLVRRATVGSG